MGDLIDQRRFTDIVIILQSRHQIFLITQAVDLNLYQRLHELLEILRTKIIVISWELVEPEGLDEFGIPPYAVQLQYSVAAPTDASYYY